MSEAKTLVTVELDASLHAALERKARITGQDLSGLVEEAIRRSLNEDELDLGAIESRQHEKPLSYGEFLAALKADGTI